MGQYYYPHRQAGMRGVLPRTVHVSFAGSDGCIVHALLGSTFFLNFIIGVISAWDKAVPSITSLV
jgi:hypothetical protein